jgi:hypothetical protein
MYPGAKLLWAKDAAGEIGKQPNENVYWCARFDEVLRSLDMHYAAIDKKGRR